MRKWVFFWVVSAVGVTLDLFTKFLADTRLPLGRPVDIVGEKVQLLLVHNKAAVFGLDPRHLIPGFPLNLVFLIFSVLAVIILLVYYHRLPSGERLTRWGIALIMPGALGNMFDRVMHPQRGVVDFLKVGISEEVYWPIFNFADIYVTVGVGLVLLVFVREEMSRGRHNEAASSPARSDGSPDG